MYDSTVIPIASSASFTVANLSFNWPRTFYWMLLPATKWQFLFHLLSLMCSFLCILLLSFKSLFFFHCWFICLTKAYILNEKIYLCSLLHKRKSLFTKRISFMNFKPLWKFAKYDLLEDLPDLWNSVPAVSSTNAAALSQHSWQLLNVSHSEPSFLNSSNQATNWTRAICSFLCLGWLMAAVWGFLAIAPTSLF